MQHLGTVCLETGRLLLRQFTPEDAGAMYRNWAGDPQVTKYLTWPAYTSPDAADATLKGWAASYAKPDFYQWAIVLKANGPEPIGSISVVEAREDTGMLQIGYCIGRPWWRQGVTSEALGAVLDFLFEQVGALRVEALHDPHNPHSGAVMRKCGMVYEGTLRQAGRNNQGICDLCYYSMLAGEYRAGKAPRP